MSRTPVVRVKFYKVIFTKSSDLFIFTFRIHIIGNNVIHRLRSLERRCIKSLSYIVRFSVNSSILEIIRIWFAIYDKSISENKIVIFRTEINITVFRIEYGFIVSIKRNLIFSACAVFIDIFDINYISVFIFKKSYKLYFCIIISCIRKIEVI